MIVYMTSEPDHTNSGMHHLIRNFFFSRLYLFCMVPLKKNKRIGYLPFKRKNQQAIERAVGFFLI